MVNVSQMLRSGASTGAVFAVWSIVGVAYGDVLQRMTPGSRPALSADGRVVAFDTGLDADPTDTNGAYDVYVFDAGRCTTERVSVATDGTQGDGQFDDSERHPDSLFPSISGDGRYVVFASNAQTLVPDDANVATDVFLRDRAASTTILVSVNPGGIEGNGASRWPVVSLDGRYVAFESDATNLVSDDANGLTDVFLHDRTTGETVRVSVAPFGQETDGGSYAPSISSDGARVAFESSASNLVGSDLNGAPDVFLWKRGDGAVERIGTLAGGEEPPLGAHDSALSSDGTAVVFASLPLGAYVAQLYLRDIDGDVVHSISGYARSFSGRPSVSSDGDEVVFASRTSAVAAAVQPTHDCFRFAVDTGIVAPLVELPASTEGAFICLQPVFAALGAVAFVTDAPLTADDPNTGFIGRGDIYERRPEPIVGDCTPIGCDHLGKDRASMLQCLLIEAFPPAACSDTSFPRRWLRRLQGAARLVQGSRRNAEARVTRRLDHALARVGHWLGRGRISDECARQITELIEGAQDAVDAH